MEKLDGKKASGKLPESGAPMLEQIGRGDPPSDKNWVYEVKWGGVRAICYIQDGQVRMISRNGNAIDRQYPELSILPHQIKAQTAIVDGEIASLNARGVPRFELWQRRINVADEGSCATMATPHPRSFYAWT